MFKGALSVTALLTGCSITLAQERGSAQDQQACSRDVSRHGRKVMDQGDDVVRQCLLQHRSKLTDACQKVLKDHGQLPDMAKLTSYLLRPIARRMPAPRK